MNRYQVSGARCQLSVEGSPSGGMVGEGESELVEWVKELQAWETCEIPIAGGEDRPVLDG